MANVDQHRIMFFPAELNKRILVKQHVAAVQDTGILHHHRDLVRLEQLRNFPVVFSGNTDHLFPAFFRHRDVIVMKDQILALKAHTVRQGLADQVHGVRIFRGAGGCAVLGFIVRAMKTNWDSFKLRQAMKKLFLIAVCVKHREQLDANLTTEGM